MVWRPEILAPAGEPACLEAAVAGGADAVYLGLRHFNARGRAANFRTADLPRHVDYLHHHGLRCYVVLNTLLHDDEFVKALRLARCAAAAGVDACIIQDLGLWRVLRQELPDMPLHASTQMTIHTPEQVEQLARLGAERVILARELSREGVAACTRQAQALGIETEHFIHGALCYAYSGQCLISNFAGCRSANRGTCAQNCRYIYQDDRGQTDSLLSMRDNSLLAGIAELATIGVASLKIEGRLKGPDYVYTVSRVYREAVESWAAGRPIAVDALSEALRGVFSRGHSDDWWRGRYGAEARVSQERQAGEADATIRTASRKDGRVLLQAATAPRPGQGYTWQSGSWSDGFLITAVDPTERPDHWRCKVRMGRHGPPIVAGTPCYRNIDQAHQRAAKEAMAGVRIDDLHTGGMPCQVTIRLRIGEPARATIVAADGRRVEGATAEVVQVATGRPVDDAGVTKSFGAFGGSGFRLARLEVAADATVFVPLAALKQLRRDLLGALAREPIPQETWQPPPLLTPAVVQTAVWVVVGNPAAAAAARAAGAAQVILDDPRIDWFAAAPPDLAAYDPSVWLRQAPHAGVSPHLAACGRGLLAGQLGQVAAARAAGLPVAADHGLNLVNLQTLLQLGELGVSAACISLECSSGECARLAARRAGHPEAPGLLLAVHGRLPAMYTASDHALAAGEQRRLTASEAEGGLPYVLQGRASSGPVLCEARELCAPQDASGTAGLVAGWMLELGHLPAATVGELVATYAALAAGDVSAVARIERITAGYATAGTFPGHLAIGSRALDQVRDRLAD